MKRRGQISLFIIVGIALLVFFSLFFMFRSGREAEVLGVQERLDANRQSVVLLVESCLQTELENAVALVGLQGGSVYAQEFPGYRRLGGYYVHYGYYLGSNLLPTAQEVEKDQIARYLELNLEECIDLSQLKDVQITTGDISVQAEVGQDHVSATLTFPITIQLQDGTAQIETFAATVPTRLGYVLDVATGIVNRDVDDPNNLDLTYLFRTGLKVEVLPLARNEHIYTIYDSESILRGTGYTFMFASLYKQNHPPELRSIDNFQIVSGQDFMYFVEAADIDNDEITFHDNTDLFDIHPQSGLMQFTATVPGRYDVEITAVDAVGDYDLKRFVIEVV